MLRPARRGPRTRLILTLAALASLVGGYYAGQFWQRRPLAELSAVIYPNGKTIDYPAGLALDDEDGKWRLFVTADSRAAPCRQLLRHYAMVINRLAAWPSIQQHTRLSVLAYDQPDPAAITEFTGGASWAEVHGAEPALLDRLAEQLGILPHRSDWCGADQNSAILVAPDRTAWALIPHEQADIMARNIRTIIDFVE